MIRATPLHAEALATIHAAAFPPGERWDARAMAEILAMPGAFGVLDVRGGLLLARSVGGEAEVLTLAVLPEARRRGLGRALLDHMLGEIGAVPVFLEVAADNEAALALYRSAGLHPCGRRAHYYGAGRDALVLRR
jgi:ribosomal-protein-alanine N-acetyltransferase